MSYLNDEQIDLLTDRILSVLGGRKAKSPLHKEYVKGVVMAIADEIEEIIIRSMAVSLADRLEEDDNST
jgi:hypothetical protein